MLFGHLSVDYCNLFFVLMVLALLFVVSNVFGLFYALTSDRHLLPLFISNLIISLFTYFMHRVLHSMCLVSLQ